jgi:hypothetical protein
MDEGRRRANQRIIKKLPEQGEKALKQLAELMEELTVGQMPRSRREMCEPGPQRQPEGVARDPASRPSRRT